MDSYSKQLTTTTTSVVTRTARNKKLVDVDKWFCRTLSDTVWDTEREELSFNVNESDSSGKLSYRMAYDPAKREIVSLFRSTGITSTVNQLFETDTLDEMEDLIINTLLCLDYDPTLWWDI